jgi:hypothetical protein
MKGHLDYTQDQLFMALFRQVDIFVNNFDSTNKDIYYTINQFRHIVHINGSLVDRRLELLHLTLSDEIREVGFTFPVDYRTVMDKAEKFMNLLSLRFS